MPACKPQPSKFKNSQSIQLYDLPGYALQDCPSLPQQRSLPSLLKDRNGIKKAPNAPF